MNRKKKYKSIQINKPGRDDASLPFTERRSRWIERLTASPVCTAYMTSNSIIDHRDERHIQALVNTTIASLADDAKMKFVCEQSTGNTEKNLRAMIIAGLWSAFSMKHGEATIISTSDVQCFALTTRRVVRGGPTTKQLIKYMCALQKYCGWHGMNRLLRIGQRIGTVRSIRTHVNLCDLCCDPASKGKGYEALILSEAIRRADLEGLPVSTQSHDPFYRKLLEQHGFVARRDVTGLPEGCPPIMYMWRDQTRPGPL